MRWGAFRQVLAFGTLLMGNSLLTGARSPEAARMPYQTLVTRLSRLYLTLRSFHTGHSDLCFQDIAVVFIEQH
jgi:hypothetical protein